ncbi:hypothetical protein P167DRAFT_211642 [Morchella conica CCBAS932]|uniref:Uncharacterized protein n=1 Tax=Morchella conica CCBAS932 TaxID=1392247 RepID=A0A3N4L114_9PEZI|nr:hypothetical protein P167DRAFT_211642 [Morchella conica CCBAS932]
MYIAPFQPTPHNSPIPNSPTGTLPPLHPPLNLHLTPPHPLTIPRKDLLPRAPLPPLQPPWLRAAHALTRLHILLYGSGGLRIAHTRLCGAADARAEAVGAEVGAAREAELDAGVEGGEAGGCGWVDGGCGGVGGVGGEEEEGEEEEWYGERTAVVVEVVEEVHCGCGCGVAQRRSSGRGEEADKRHGSTYVGG